MSATVQVLGPWEYKWRHISSSDHDGAATLTALSAEGWDVVAVFREPDGWLKVLTKRIVLSGTPHGRNARCRQTNKGTLHFRTVQGRDTGSTPLPVLRRGS